MVNSSKTGNIKQLKLLETWCIRSTMIWSLAMKRVKKWQGIQEDNNGKLIKGISKFKECNWDIIWNHGIEYTSCISLKWSIPTLSS